MKRLGKASTIEEYEEQIDYIESIISTLEDLQILYGKSKDFDGDYKDTQNQLDWLEETYQDLCNEKQELVDVESIQHEYDIQAMNYEFERDRL